MRYNPDAAAKALKESTAQPDNLTKLRALLAQFREQADASGYHYFAVANDPNDPQAGAEVSGIVDHPDSVIRKHIKLHRDWSADNGHQDVTWDPTALAKAAFVKQAIGARSKLLARLANPGKPLAAVKPQARQISFDRAAPYRGLSTATEHRLPPWARSKFEIKQPPKDLEHMKMEARFNLANYGRSPFVQVTPQMRQRLNEIQKGISRPRELGDYLSDIFKPVSRFLPTKYRSKIDGNIALRKAVAERAAPYEMFSGTEFDEELTRQLAKARLHRVGMLEEARLKKQFDQVALSGRHDKENAVYRPPLEWPEKYPPVDPDTRFRGYGSPNEIPTPWDMVPENAPVWTSPRLHYSAGYGGSIDGGYVAKLDTSLLKKKPYGPTTPHIANDNRGLTEEQIANLPVRGNAAQGHDDPYYEQVFTRPDDQDAFRSVLENYKPLPSGSGFQRVFKRI